MGQITTSSPLIGDCEITAVTTPVTAGPTPEIVVPATMVRFYDGDTCTIRVSQDYHIRLLDAWCPELKEPGGIAARDTMIAKCPPGTDITVRVPYHNDFSKMFSFGRVLGYVYRGPTNLSEYAVEQGVAKKNK